MTNEISSHIRSKKNNFEHYIKLDSDTIKHLHHHIEKIS